MRRTLCLGLVLIATQPGCRKTVSATAPGAEARPGNSEIDTTPRGIDVDAVADADVDVRRPEVKCLTTMSEVESAEPLFTGAVKLYPLPVADLAETAELIGAELRRYPSSVLSSSVRRVYVVGHLSARGVAIGGWFSGDCVILARQPDRSPLTQRHLRRAVHHEISSLLIRAYPEAFDQEAWRRMAPKDFKYGHGGLREINSGRTGPGSPRLWRSGFLEEYAHSSAENDMNCYAEELFAGDGKLWSLASEYPRIRTKLNLLLGMYGEVDRGLSDQHFRACQGTPQPGNPRWRPPSERARAFYDDLVKRGPTDPSVWLARAALRVNLARDPGIAAELAVTRIDGAIDDFQRALKLTPSHGLTWSLAAEATRLKASLAARMGDPAEALVLLRRAIAGQTTALELDHTLRRAVRGRATAYLDRAEMAALTTEDVNALCDTALAELDGLLAQAPDQGVLWELSGRAHYAKALSSLQAGGRPRHSLSEALQRLSRAGELDPSLRENLKGRVAFCKRALQSSRGAGELNGR